MSNISIKKIKPNKVGNSFYFRIPRVFIKNNIIDTEKFYNILADETKENELNSNH